jgi:hypothetical protein
MTTEEIVREQFRTHKIAQMQLDPNGLCNAGCWFCPVAYKGNPAHAKKAMPVDLLRKIIENMISEREREDGLVSKNFGGFYTSHYNETLLYPHLREFFEILREHRLVTMILSNGTTLTPNKVDLLKEYQDVLSGINLNVPVLSSRERWAKRTNMKEHLYDKLIRNIKYAVEVFPDMARNRSFSLGMNGINSLSFMENGGWIEKGPNFPEDIDLDPVKGENAMEVHVAKFLFPDLHVYGMPHLIDRAGLLDDVITNKEGIHKYLKASEENKKVVACGNGIEVGGRPVGWLHVNAIGQAFLCCNDYDMEIIVGDFKTQNLRDFWGNDQHIQKVVESYQTICRNCASAKFE